MPEIGKEDDMSTARTCTTPKDGWALYHHFLGNLLLAIRMQGWDREEGEESEEKKDKREKIIGEAWAQLVGNLYMIMRRMKLNGHDEDASKMQQIIDMTVEQDLTLQEVCDAIHSKENELWTPHQDFIVEVERLRAEHRH